MEGQLNSNPTSEDQTETITSLNAPHSRISREDVVKEEAGLERKRISMIATVRNSQIGHAFFYTSLIPQRPLDRIVTNYLLMQSLNLVCSAILMLYNSLLLYTCIQNDIYNLFKSNIWLIERTEVVQAEDFIARNEAFMFLLKRNIFTSPNLWSNYFF
jgi:hypothetical protein